MKLMTSILSVIGLAMAGCQTRDHLLLKDSDFPADADEDGVPWKDLGDASPNFDAQTSVPVESVSKALQKDYTLFTLAKNYQIERPKLLGVGVVGRRKDSVLYATTWARLQQSEDRAYWDLIRVLSQRYGCLMRQRQKHADGYTFTCRDHRQVTLRFQRDGEHYLIVGNQRDRFGRDLFVQSK